METGTPVTLYMYDLSQGLATAMSLTFLGHHIEAVWHTSIVVYDKEFYFGGQGILHCIPGGTVLGRPLRQLILGHTHLPFHVFQDYLGELATSNFRPTDYSLLRHNCNNFSNEVAQFLCGASIPSEILDLPDTLLSTPIGLAIAPLLQGLDRSPNIRETSPELHQAIEKARQETRALEQNRRQISQKLARSDKKQQKRERKAAAERHRILNCEAQLIQQGYHFRDLPGMGDDGAGAAAGGEVTEEVSEVSAVTRKARDVVAEIAEEEAREAAETRKKQREPPITFKDAVDVRCEFDALVGLIDGKLSPDEQTSLEELHTYMVDGEGSWALGDSFLLFIGRLLHDKTLCAEVRVRTLHVLALAALKDDVILLLHQDRREHVLMNYAADVEKLSLDEQQALALFLANLFEHASCSEWMLYISEWSYCNATLSNIRVSTRVAINALLSDVPLLQDRATAIIHNMACKEVKTVVFDDVAVELTMALLQYLNSSPSEELLFRTLKSLARFCQVSTMEVPQLINMVGPDPARFLGASPRIDQQIALIQAKLSR